MVEELLQSRHQAGLATQQHRQAAPLQRHIANVKAFHTNEEDGALLRGLTSFSGLRKCLTMLFTASPVASWTWAEVGSNQETASVSAALLHYTVLKEVGELEAGRS